MKKIYSILAIMILTIILCGLVFFSYKAYIFPNLPKPNPTNTTIIYPPALDFKLVTIEQIKNNISNGNYNFEGYVLKISPETGCGPCPKNALCGLCRPSLIIISQYNPLTNQETNKTLLDNKELYISNIKTPNQFELNKKYLFSVNVHYSPDSHLFVDILGYRLIE